MDKALPPGDLSGIKEYLAYDPASGRFDWIKRPKGAARWRDGEPAGCVRSDGYRMINWKGRPYLAHHLAWWFVHGTWPNRIDHRDKDSGNNAIGNLRESSKSQNAANSKGWARRASPYKGTHQRGNRYTAACAGKYLGCFPTAEDAARAYDAAATARFGEFASLNFPDRRTTP